MKQDTLVFPLLIQRPLCTSHVKLPSKLAPHPLEPANFISIIRGFQSIHESLTIDPALDIPLSLRPPRTQTEPTEAKRNNVNLKVHNAEIAADILIVEPNLGITTVPAKVYARSDVGDITIQMHRQPIQANQSRVSSRTRRRSVLMLSVRAGRGDVFVSIPRNFHGPLRVTSKGLLCVSPALSAASFRTLAESSCGMLFRTRECFLGKDSESNLNLVEEEDEEDEDEGEVTQMDAHSSLPDDEITIEAKGGRVYLQFNDERWSERQVEIDAFKQSNRTYETSRNVRSV